MKKNRNNIITFVFYLILIGLIIFAFIFVSEILTKQFPECIILKKLMSKVNIKI